MWPQSWYHYSMPAQLAKHGTQAGYKAEIAASGKSCPRCLNAHRRYNQQYTASGKRQGLRFTSHQVLDASTSTGPALVLVPPRPRGITPESSPEPSGEPSGKPVSQTLGQRLGAVLGSARPPEEPGGYVVADEPHEYISAIDPDPAPEGDEWEPAGGEDDFVINAAGMKKISDNLGFYFTTVGMTLEIIDPYCGAVAAANATNVIERWTKVIAAYPKTAEFFMSERSGTLFAWINALQATWPILYAIFEHHFSKTVMIKDGVVYRKNPDGTPATAAPDATTPPMPGYDYSLRGNSA